jgi:1-acyl-sn-glycerol-3-phosphate acyltransferase
VRNWKRGHFPKVDVAYGDVIRWDRIGEPTRDQQQAVANEIFGRIKELYATLED